MISIISAFYSQAIQDELKKDMENQDISFVCADCANTVTLVMELEKNPNVDVVIVDLSEVRNTDAQLAQIRDVSKTVRIVPIISGLRKQYVQSQLDGYRKRYNIEDIIFEGKGLDKFEILSIMSKGRLSSEQEITEKNPVEEQKAVEILNPAEKVQETVVEENTYIEEKPIPKKVKQEKPKRDRLHKKNICTRKLAGECLVISIFGTTRGAGVTNMTASLAEYFAGNGKRVIAFNLSGGDEFRCINGQAEYRDVQSVNISEFEKDYDVILIDLGVPYRISSGGHYSGFSDGYDYRNIELLKKSSLRIVMSLSDAWHIKKCEYFLSDEQWAGQISDSYIFLFDTEPPKSLRKYTVNKFDRNSQSFADEIAELFSLE